LDKFKTIKNADETLDLPLDFKNFDRKPTVKTFAICDCQREI